MRRRLSASQWTSLLLAALLSALTVYWAMIVLAPRPAIAPARGTAEPTHAPPLDGAASLFGRATDPGTPAVNPAAAVVVTGVLATGAAGVAVLSVDGGPAKPYGLDEQVTDQIKLVRIAADRVELQHPGGLLRLPTPARPALEVLTRGPSGVAPPSAPSLPHTAARLSTPPDAQPAMAGRPSVLAAPTLPLTAPAPQAPQE